MTFKDGKSGNPRGRPKGKLQRSLTREAIIKQHGSLEVFFDKVVKLAEEGDGDALRFVLSRVEAPLRPKAEPVHFDLDDSDLPAALNSIIQATADGQIDPLTAKDLTQAISSAATAKHQVEVENRLAVLEESLNAR